MGVFFCKVCGSPLKIAEGKTIAVCEYCETSNVIHAPPHSADQEKILKRARICLESREFDSAIKQFNKALDLNPELSEAYWGLFLAKNSYSSDLHAAKGGPSLIVDSRDYKNACRFANEEEKKKYESILKMATDAEQKYNRQRAREETERIAQAEAVRKDLESQLKKSEMEMKNLRILTLEPIYKVWKIPCEWILDWFYEWDGCLKWILLPIAFVVALVVLAMIFAIILAGVEAISLWLAEVVAIIFLGYCAVSLICFIIQMVYEHLTPIYKRKIKRRNQLSSEIQDLKNRLKARNTRGTSLYSEVCDREYSPQKRR